MASGNTVRRLRNTDLKVDATDLPGWHKVPGRTPECGEIVYCTEGMAEVARICGKTSDGSRLLELRLLDRTAPPFFAAASNILSREDKE